MEIELDRISNLPSDIIERILSLLPIREAMRTSVLSSNWRYKSARLQTLVFDGQCVLTQKHTTFVNIVDQVLVLHIGPIHMFQLAHPDLVGGSDVDRWILHLSRNSIKVLVLEFLRGEEGNRYKMPSCLFSCQDMVHLELFNCVLKPPSTFQGFKSLKGIYFESVALSQDAFENLIVCCPRLETLSLLNCDGFTHLKIDAPNLKMVCAEGIFENASLENTLNLADVHIGFNVNVDQTRVRGNSGNLLKFFVHVPRIVRLTIEGYFLKYLAIGALPGKLPEPCLFLNFLSISIRFNNLEEISTALCLLRSSPSLQELEIWVHQEDQAVVGEVNSWLDDNQNCPFTQLRHVKITGITGVKAELDFIRFLLLSSPVLESMTVEPASDNGSSELLKKMIRFRRSSVHAEMIFLDP